MSVNAIYVLFESFKHILLYILGMHLIVCVVRHLRAIENILFAMQGVVDKLLIKLIQYEFIVDVIHTVYSLEWINKWMLT